MNMKKILGALTAAALAATALVMPTSAADSYKAGVAFQTGDWNYRNNVEQDDFMGVAGAESEDYEDYEYNDVEITKDGSYTVSITGLPESASEFKFIQLSTTIPCTKDADGNVLSDVTIEVTEVKEGGSAVALDFSKAKMESGDGMLVVSLINEWNNDMKDNPAIPNGIFDSIEITFTVSGMGGGESNENPGENTEAPGENTENPGESTDKPATNTGIEGVAVVAGLAILATGAVVIAKKRK